MYILNVLGKKGKLTNLMGNKKGKFLKTKKNTKKFQGKKKRA
jgi:hypothetical protein